MIIGIVSIIIAIMGTLLCFYPGAMSFIGVFLSLAALLMVCLSTFKGEKKHLVCVLILVTFNIFIVSELSFALNKNLYSHGETPLRKVIHLITYSEEDRFNDQKNLIALEKHLGHKVEIDYTKKEQGYWSFVKIALLIVLFPYSIALLRLYFLTT